MKKEVSAKLKIQPGKITLVQNAPDGFLSPSDKVDISPKSGQQYDIVLLFVKSKNDIDKLSKLIPKSLKADSLLWVAYPKKSAVIKTDLTRDYGWDSLTTVGLEAVSLVSIDDTWSALRFKSSSMTNTRATEKKTSGKKKFKAIIARASEGMDAAYVEIPFDVEKEYGTKGQVKIKALFEGHPYRGILSNMGTGCHILGIRKDIRQAIGKNIGDTISVELERDLEERVVAVPDDLKKAFAKSKKAEQFFNTLSFTNRKEYAVWITSAKKQETRDKRLAETIEKLLAEKKNPSAK